MALIKLEQQEKNLPDSLADNTYQSFGSGSGDRRFNIPGNWENDDHVYDFYLNDVEFYFFTRNDLLDYIHSLSEELNYPTQAYSKFPNNDIKSFYDIKIQEIKQMPEITTLHFVESSRSGGTAYIANDNDVDGAIYNKFREICLSSSKQGPKNAYTNYRFVKYKDTTTGKCYMNLIPIFSKKYNMEELANILKRDFDANGDWHTFIYVFGMRYAEQILSSSISCEKLVETADIDVDDVAQELKKAVTLFKYIKENKISINPIDDKIEILGAYLDQSYEHKTKNNTNVPLDGEPLQQIFYGAPGTGKSDTIKQIVDNNNRICYRTTFHPDSDYSTFVGCYKPTMENKKQNIKLDLSFDDLASKLNEYYNDPSDGKVEGIRRFCYEFYKYIDGEYMKVNVTQLVKKAGLSTNYETEVNKYVAFCHLLPEQEDNKIIYSFVPQAFTNAYVRAWSTNEPVFLVIEEINRGNCAQIFGDLFQLLDRKNGESEYPVKADTDLAKHLADELVNSSREDIPLEVKSGEMLKLPSNLYIWATMNTSDQSLFPIDSAFKRRWDWKYIKIAKGYERDDNGVYKTNSEGEKIPLGWKLLRSDGQDWWEFIKKINAIIYSMTQSADKQLGYFFCKADKDKIITTETFVNKVAFYLWNDVFKDYAEDEGDLFKFKKKLEDNEDIDLTFPDFFDEDGKEIEAVAQRFIKNVMSWKVDEKKEKNED